MTKRIFRSICLVAMAVFLACLVLILGVLYGHFTKSQQNQLRAQTDLAAQGIAIEGAAFLEGIESLENRDFRLTWIDPEGRVLYDSGRDVSAMENHLRREEVREALETGFGESLRYSSTLTEHLLYCAERLPDGSVVRLSSTHASVVLLVLGMLQPFLLILVIAVALSLILAHRLSRRIVDPLNQLNLDDPAQNSDYPELQPLLLRIDSQQRQLRAQSRTLQRRQDEFDTVTGSMTEGLVLLNNKGCILSINPAASALLGTGADCPGKHLLAVNDSLQLQELLVRAREGRPARVTMSLRGRSYECSASPVFSEGMVSGAALLIFDVTEREQAEQIRREFTANVSHELKTPLHSISGCAELLQRGMVKPEDQPQFSAQIYTEAQRMIHLVEDIIRLSRLDEGVSSGEKEAVDLRAMAQELLQSLRPESEKQGVCLCLSGDSPVLTAEKALLHSILYNLCDNALKYNRPGGRVELHLADGEDTVTLTVSDTGIGIPPEHQERIFERFYRVDKSHSKEVGGTGLGLSIVKHAARQLGASVRLESQVDKGTVITLQLPK